jgi:hypothetical protein
MREVAAKLFGRRINIAPQQQEKYLFAVSTTFFCAFLLLHKTFVIRLQT